MSIKTLWSCLLATPELLFHTASFLSASDILLLAQTDRKSRQLFDLTEDECPSDEDIYLPSFDWSSVWFDFHSLDVRAFALRHTRHVRCLRLSFDAWLQCANRLPDLQSLHIFTDNWCSSQSFGPDKCRAGTVGYRSLQNLTLSGTKIHRGTLQTVLRFCPKVTTLSLQQCHLDTVAIGFITQLRVIRHVSINDCRGSQALSWRYHRRKPIWFTRSFASHFLIDSDVHSSSVLESFAHMSDLETLELQSSVVRYSTVRYLVASGKFHRVELNGVHCDFDNNWPHGAPFWMASGSTGVFRQRGSDVGRRQLSFSVLGDSNERDQDQGQLIMVTGQTDAVEEYVVARHKTVSYGSDRDHLCPTTHPLVDALRRDCKTRLCCLDDKDPTLVFDGPTKTGCVLFAALGCNGTKQAKELQSTLRLINVHLIFDTSE